MLKRLRVPGSRTSVESEVERLQAENLGLRILVAELTGGQPGHEGTRRRWVPAGQVDEIMVQRARAAPRSAPFVVEDETSWRHRTSRAWLWVMATECMADFTILPVTSDQG